MSFDTKTELFEPAGPPPVTEDRSYERYARPDLAGLLRVLKLDLAFHRAEGDRLWFRDEEGDREILDLLGGSGACLLGHNHPEIVAEARRLLDERVPVQAQGSLRKAAGELARVLSDRVRPWLGEESVVTLCNSGSEAIEAAIRMAELERVRRRDEILEEFAQRSSLIRRRVRDGTCTIPDDFYPRLAVRVGTPSIRDLDEALFHWNRVVLHTFDRRPVFLALEGAFHGRTCGAVQLTHEREERLPFLGLGFPVVFVPHGDTDGLQRAVREQEFDVLELDIDAGNALEIRSLKRSNVAAIFVEPVQGEGGVRVLDRGFAAAIRAVADRVRFPVVADEVQSGLGRTGWFLAAEAVGLKPDYVVWSGGLGGGLAKIGAVAVSRGRFPVDPALRHASTFAEDEPSCRIALKTLEILSRDDGALIEECRQKGEYLLRRLEFVREKHPTILKEVRGLGLMVGIEFHEQTRTSSRLLYTLSRQRLLAQVLCGWLLHEEGVRVGAGSSGAPTLRVEPSALVDAEELERFIAALDRLCEILKKANMFQLVRHLVGLAAPGSRGRVLDFSQNRPMTPVPRFAKRVAILGHYASPEHMALWEPSLYLMPRIRLEEFFRNTCRVLDPEFCDQFLVRSQTGECVALAFIGLSITADNILESLRNRDLEWIQAKIDRGVRMAKDMGCTVVGFGGFTSIVTNECKSVREGGIGLTTGSSLTTAAGLVAVAEECARIGIDLGKARVAAVGASGNICAVYAMLLAERAPEIVLVGRPGTEEALRRIAAEICFEAYKAVRVDPSSDPGGVAGRLRETRAMARVLESTEGIPRIGEFLFDALREELGADRWVRTTTDFAAIRECDVIVTATGGGTPSILPEHLRPGPVLICDIAVPRDVSPLVAAQRPDALVIHGGAVRLPGDQEVVVPGIPVEEGQTFACMAETMLLGLTGIATDYSYGAITKMQVRKIMELAKIHGFRLGRGGADRPA